MYFPYTMKVKPKIVIRFIQDYTTLCITPAHV